MKNLRVFAKSGSVAACIVALLLMSARSAHATAITISDCYTGDCANLIGSISLTITDDSSNENSGADDLKFVIVNNTNGFVDQLGLFYTGGLSGAPAIEGFVGTGGTGQPALSLAKCSTDNSLQGLNVCFDFPQPNATRFDAGDSVTFFLDSNTAAFLASSFVTTGAFAHNNEVDGGGGSAKITDRSVPEPGALLLMGSALLSAMIARRRGLRASAAVASHPSET
jgi:hypothetical protein